MAAEMAKSVKHFFVPTRYALNFSPRKSKTETAISPVIVAKIKDQSEKVMLSALRFLTPSVFMMQISALRRKERNERENHLT
jgi:hypothetical protein